MSCKIKQIYLLLLNVLLRLPETSQKSPEPILVNIDNSCITNRDSAIVFNPPISEIDEGSGISSEFFPKPRYHCKIEYGEDCTENEFQIDDWSLEDSINGPINGEVLDRRWEEFKVYKTEDEISRNTLKFKEIGFLKKQGDFVIPFSVRINYESHVFLCERDVTNSNCYWIMLEVFKNNHGFAVRSCKAREISDKIGEYPADNCYSPKDNITLRENLLDNNLWVHIVITKTGDTVTVKANNNKLLTFEDENQIQPRKIFFHSKRTEGLWKLHKYTYLFSSTVPTDMEQLGPTYFEFVKGTNCLALFVIMCSSCMLNVRIIAKNRQRIFNETYNTQNERWKEFKIVFEVEHDVKGTMWIRKSFAGTGHGIFWAIDEIRTCDMKEYRILKSQIPDTICQDIADDKLIDVDKKSDIAKLSNSRCSEGTFGSTCIPCTILETPKCSSLKYCELFNGEKTCYCTAGYQSNSCSKICAYSFYGHGCTKSCPHCPNDCNYIDGKCEGKYCLHDFSGEKCDIPPAPLLKHAPDITRITSTSCTVYINDFEFIGNYSPRYYKIQYKENSTWSDWIDAETGIYINDSKYVYIYPLQPDSSYCIRAMLYSNPADIYYGIAVPTKCFITTCTPYYIDDIIIITDNTSATITMDEGKDDKCKISNYKYDIDSQEQNVLEKKITLKNLKPFHNYTITIRHVKYADVAKMFTTKAGIPSRVQNLIVTEISTTGVHLKWNNPKTPNGDVKFIIQCEYLGKENCPYPSENYTTITSSVTDKYIDLQAYSKYKIKVAAQTTWATGKYSSVEIETKSLDFLTNYERPSIGDMEVFYDSVVVYINPIDCKYINGPIYLKFETVCISEWCEQMQDIKSVKYPYYNNVSKYGINNLQPYTKYNLFLSLSRKNEDDWSNNGNVEFTTDPSVPSKTASINVAWWDEESIFIRWVPPYPPTGILAKYKISYNSVKYEQDIQPCTIWPNYHCAAIARQGSSRMYRIDILARNESPDQYASILNKPLQVDTDVREPEPPYGVEGTWTKRNYLNISWKHPNAINGKLKHFVINIKGLTPVTRKIDNEKDYRLTYTNTITLPFTPCTKYNAKVVVFNEKYNSASKETEVWSPPPYPKTSKDAMKIKNGTNDTINIEISKLSLERKNITSYTRKMYILQFSTERKKDLVDSFMRALKQSSDLTEFNNTRMNYREYTIGTTSDTSVFVDKKKRCSIFLVNRCHNTTRVMKIENLVPFEEHSEDKSNKGLYALMLLLLLIPLIAYVYIYKLKNNSTNMENCLSALKLKPNERVDEVPLKRNEPTNVSYKSRRLPHAVPSFVLKTTHSNVVKINDFEMYVKRSIETGELEKQHEIFPRGQTKPWEYGSLKENKLKNRYNNLVAYDHTRVKLAELPGVEYSDYINANYIDGYKVPKAYIATQGPKATTLNDFWRMVWQENVKHIVMLANILEGGKKKVEKYWPNINEDMDFNGIRVQYLSSKVYANYEHRVFKVFNKDKEREISQLHFTTWPDHGVPLYSQSLVPFLQEILKIPNSTQSPVVVHCSAGVGRTGTIILCDICLRMAAGEGAIDFLANLEHLRSQRPNMVDNVEQYKLAHLVVLECLFGMHTSISCDEDMNKNITDLLAGNGVANQLKYLTETEWEDRAMDTIWRKTENLVTYPEKNRVPDILPDKNYQICLGYYPFNDETSSYINAVQVDGFRSPGRFIVTQQPLPNTLGDFWRMVWEQQSTVIISLNEIDTKDKTSCLFWPEMDCTLNPVDHLTIRYMNAKIFNSYEIIEVQVVNKDKKEALDVNIVAMKNWMPNTVLPNSISEFLTFCEECDIISRKSETIIITCYDGATASGLYVATTFLIDKMKLEQECDVCLAVRTIRHNRKQFVTSEEQFKFLYKVAIMYIEGFQSYANFA